MWVPWELGWVIFVGTWRLLTTSPSNYNHKNNNKKKPSSITVTSAAFRESPARESPATTPGLAEKVYYWLLGWVRYIVLAPY